LETGLDKSTQTRRISEVFDSKNLTIYVPHMKKYCYSESYDYKRRYDSERQEWLRKTIALAPKAVLVVGNSLADIDSIFYAMRKVVKGRKHIHYNTDPKAYDEFVSGKKNNVVIYGSEKLYTGMDLPGRVSMVVLLKAFNDVRVITGPYYNIVGDRVFDETGRRVADEYNKLYRYNTCRATIQATGRIMRQHGDQGVVMLLSDNTNDAHMLKQQFKNAPLVRDEMTAWPYGTP
jgi:Rad3-related DNA helicase